MHSSGIAPCKRILLKRIVKIGAKVSAQCLSTEVGISMTPDALFVFSALSDSTTSLSLKFRKEKAPVVSKPLLLLFRKELSINFRVSSSEIVELG